MTDTRRIADALESIAAAVHDGVLQMRDVDRASVYKEHLGKKLSEPEPEPEPEQANLGLATTRQLLQELDARFRLGEWDGDAYIIHLMLSQLPEDILEYRTVDS